jgi:peptidylprolyl isomerase domain and WD repeat-containing protein 1
MFPIYIMSEEPKPSKQQRVDASLFLDCLPCSKLYEKSYMHKDVILWVLCSSLTGFLATAGSEGFVKFWKKQSSGIEFAKSYRAHLSAVTCMTLSYDGRRLATCNSTERSIKVFDVNSCDMINMLKLEFQPEALAFVHGNNTPEAVIAV